MVLCIVFAEMKKVARVMELLSLECLTTWGLNNMAYILQTTGSIAFAVMKMVEVLNTIMLKCVIDHPIDNHAALVKIVA